MCGRREREGERGENGLTLENIVGIRVGEHQADHTAPIGSRGEDLVNKSAPVTVLGVDDTLFNYVAGKLLLSEGEELTADFRNDEGAIGAVTLFNNPLNDIVAVLVLNQILRIAVQVVEEDTRLRGGAIFKDALKDPTAVGVGGERLHLTNAGVGDEDELIRGNSLKGALHKNNKSSRVSQAFLGTRQKRRVDSQGNILGPHGWIGHLWHI